MKLENFFNYYKPNIYYRAIFFTKKKKKSKISRFDDSKRNLNNK